MCATGVEVDVGLRIEEQRGCIARKRLLGRIFI